MSDLERDWTKILGWPGYRVYRHSHTPVPLLRRGRGYRNLNYLLLKVQRLAFTETEFITIRKAPQNA